MEEVLQQQSESIQTFLLHTSILNRLCGPLCDSVVLDPSAFGQKTLEYLEHANLFILPLDNERRWYRYDYNEAALYLVRKNRGVCTNCTDTRASGMSIMVRRLMPSATRWLPRISREPRT